MVQAGNLKPVFKDQDILVDTSDCHFSDNRYISPPPRNIFVLSFSHLVFPRATNTDRHEGVNNIYIVREV